MDRCAVGRCAVGRWIAIGAVWGRRKPAVGRGGSGTLNIGFLLSNLITTYLARTHYTATKLSE